MKTICLLNDRALESIIRRRITGRSLSRLATLYAQPVASNLIRKGEDNIVDEEELMKLYGQSWFPRDSQDVQAWLARYRRKTNPDVELYFINPATYGRSVTPQREPKVTYVSGWSEGILKYAAATGCGFDLVDEIHSLVL